MESTSLFKSQRGNFYLYDNKMSYLINCHPILSEIIVMSKEEGTNILQHLCKKFPQFTQDDFKYYYHKFLFLQENGLFQKMDMEKHLAGKISALTVDEQIANVNDIVFQITNLCNLSCVYCCYGELYDNTDRDTLHNVMNFSEAKKIIDYLVEKWNSTKNLSYKGQIMIGFYGGEPLTNFALIKQIVEYTKNIRLKNHATFLYNMTTNSTFLNKYMDFLVKHNFSLLLSLDGNKIHNSLRIDKKGKPSFDRVFKNIKLLQNTYPDFFKRNVRFNSVLNIKSDVLEVKKFIKEEFQKDTGIETITYSGIRNDKHDEFFKIYRHYDENEETLKKTKNAGFFFYYRLNNAFHHHIELLRKSRKETPKIPTGTCLPFWKKMFITPGGSIYACERIGFKHSLGQIRDKVNIDTEKIAEKYNSYYSAISRQCMHCYQADSCSLCMMQFEQAMGNRFVLQWLLNENLRNI